MTGRLSRAIPRTLNFHEFTAEPLNFLARARSSLGDMFVLREGAPVFSRASDCTGVVAVFGTAGQRAVLSDIEAFGMPMSAAVQLALPPKLVNLNFGLHSMRGTQHAAQRRLLTAVLSEGMADDDGAVRAALEASTQGWRPGVEIPLLQTMRQLALEVSSCVLFGDGLAHRSELVSLLHAYFDLRREVSSPAAAADPAGRDALVGLGSALDAALRAYVRRCRRPGGTSTRGLLARLARAGSETGTYLEEDAVIGHSNVVFVSSTEPVAIALTWILLLLSQLPDLRDQIRKDLERAEPGEAAPAAGGPGRVVLLDQVIDECLRLLPPNAIMVRVTTRPTRLLGVSLPARCEIVLCPFVSHRDPARFPRPESFVPARWGAARPSPFEYFPFGAGGHACVGRGLAHHVLTTALSCLLKRYDLVLAGDQDVDWRIHIQFMPRTDPRMTVHAAGTARARDAGRLSGPVARLVSLHGEHDAVRPREA